MKSIINLQNIGILLFSIFFMISCDSDNENPSPTPEINIEEAKLSDFPLFGIQYTGIQMVSPVVVDNKEVTYGDIKITVPSNISLDKIRAAITSKELNLSKFNMSPNDAPLSFENQKVQVYIISSATGNKEALLHYNVSIIKENISVPETLKISSFTFEKSKNLNIIPNDITISRRAEVNVGYEKIYLLVPVGTDFTKLVPTITYEGSHLYYTQDSSISPVNMNVEFPGGDASFDFKYPKTFILAVKDKNNDKVMAISVIVDVVNPVKIEMVSVTTPDVTQGTSGYLTGVTKWTNQGNNKLNFQKATTYEDISPVITSPLYKVINANRRLPSQGLLPGESANVNVRISQYPPEGTYKATAVFYSRIFQDFNSDDLFEPAKVIITTKIVK